MKWLKARRERKQRINEAVEAGVVALNGLVPFNECMQIIQNRAGEITPYNLAVIKLRALDIAVGPPYSYERRLEGKLAAWLVIEEKEKK